MEKSVTSVVCLICYEIIDNISIAGKSAIKHTIFASFPLNVFFNVIFCCFNFFFTSSEIIIKENYIQRFKSAPDTGKRSNNNKCMQAEGNILKLKEKKVLHIKKRKLCTSCLSFMFVLLLAWFVQCLV